MSRPCGYPLVDGGACAHRIADPNRVDCGRHEAHKEQVGPRTVDERGCSMREVSPHSWRCLVHTSAAWATAQALGAQLPCRIPLVWTDRRRLARQVTIDLDTALLLAADPNAVVRQSLIENTWMRHARVMEYLVADPTPGVRRMLAEREAVPSSVLERLSNDPQADVRVGVAYNSAAPAFVLDRLSQSSTSSEMQWALLRNPSVPPSVLAHLAHSLDTTVRLEVAKMDRTPNTALMQLAHDAIPWVRGHAMRNANVSLEQLQQLAADSDPMVSSQAMAVLLRRAGGRR